MDASEFFNKVVKPNYDDFTKMDDYRSLWNAIVSMNTVPEYMALEQLQYARVPRQTLDAAAKQIRGQDPSLIDLKTCAEALKHVRKTTYSNKQGSFEMTISSTIASSIDKATWTFVDSNGVSYDLADVARRAFAALCALVP
jgi:hypothetical protein